MVESTLDQFGEIDILINNAGRAFNVEAGKTSGPFVETAKEDWDYVIGICLYGVLNCISAVLPGMIQRKYGKIVNVASHSGLHAVPEMMKAMPYNIAKSAIIHYTRCLAAELGPFNINVNCISPSYLLTPMHASTPVVVRERIRELTPLGYCERPEDLHGAVVFLASAASNM